MNSIPKTALIGGICSAAALLAACGGGGGSSAQPAPTPAPPTLPPPPPPPASAFDDAEYKASNSAVSAKALAAYDKGATGAGVKVAVIDTGINPTLPEFAGRIDPASQDVAANRGISDDQGHGSMVSGVIAANRDGSYMQGVAFNATILSLNVYDPAGCKPGNDCFLDDKIDEAIDLARTNGARIINMSFGDEEGMTADVWPAIQRAVDAGILIVMSAGNGGTANPNGFAIQNIQNHGGSGLFIIAGAMDANRNISSFSDRAGATGAAQHYLTALGRGNATVNHLGQHVAVNGTSFSAPTIAGAAALLASAFPNLTGAQIVQLLLSSADDAGATGTDSTFGRGILNIERAFQPQGTTSMAGSKTPISATSNGYLSAPMGDSGDRASAGAVILDGYSRAYVLDVAKTLRKAALEQPLQQAIGGIGYRSGGMAAGPVAMSITVRDGGFGTPFIHSEQLHLHADAGARARAVAGVAVTRLSPRSAMAFGFSQNGRALQEQLAGRSGQAFLIARDPLLRTGFHASGTISAGLRHSLGPIAVTVVGESGRVFEPITQARESRARYTRVGGAIDGKAGPLRLGLGASRLMESETLLGARLSHLLASPGSATAFLDAEADLAMGRGWNASALVRRGWTAIRSGTVGAGGKLGTDAWSFGLSKSSLFGSGDALAFRIAQPLRVRSGGISVSLPTRYDYASGRADHERQSLSLAPSGREVAYEASYGRPLFGGFLDLHGFARTDPGHIERSRQDLGAAVRFTLK